ncbi:CoB--CoM heterodisulfide reductase iron-sulfur subunit A family protein [Carboxydocella sp. ULO1]|uniref:CoB--CoM heterodisulfide reductase iron-sulfur subunit A family protein n=3 Tax=unclassified Carboxydocella TaxID=2685367 RepID=UPI0009ACD692|nr:CoB--CoM heterodisulfide reductase iron-sulfur subunit A family protein [Carboxydocella sp. ULO1]GAW27832.1 disulfide reductase [Carboxydocella sp. ULO1]
MGKTGVFVCWCGSNIGGVVNVPQVVEAVRSLPGVVLATDHKYTCSEPGQQMIISAIQEHGLERVVVASCSPRMHELTFRKTLKRAGLNPYMLEMANLREHCSWIHSHLPQLATEKAIALVKKAIAKVSRAKPLFEDFLPINKRALVIGGGIAGLQAALDIAEHGYEVVLVEKEPTIGGKMAALDKTFPTLDCSACICTPKMVEAAQHPKIKIYTLAEVAKVEGYLGNFTVTVHQKPRYIDLARCSGCGICESKCPSKVASEFEQGLSMRTAIYRPFPQAVPNKPVIDARNCRKIQENKCGLCAKICPNGAIDYTQQEELIQEQVGAIVVATGYELFDWTRYEEYGGGRYQDVISGLQLERLLNASGPTGGKILRPSDGKVPRSVVLVKCVGSRDYRKGKSYCSRACCMYTAKHAMQIKEKIPSAEVYVFYMDVRTAGKMYEEFYLRAVEEYGVNYLRGRVAKIYERDNRLIVWGEDTLSGQKVEIAADLVVLATGMVPAAGAEQLAQICSFAADSNGFYMEAHPKLRPVETNTAGIFLAGCCQGPKDIPDTVAQASAAASKVTALFAQQHLVTNPMVAEVNEQLCSGCMHCQSICPYHALEFKESQGRWVTMVNKGLCQGCGACTVACRSGALNLSGYTNEQLLAEVVWACQ